MNFEYIQSEIGKNSLKQIKRIETIYKIIYVITILIYLEVYMTFIKESGKVLIYLVIYVINLLLINKSKKNMLLNMMRKEICLDGFINWNIYMYNSNKNKKNVI